MVFMKLVNTSLGCAENKKVKEKTTLVMLRVECAAEAQLELWDMI